MATSTTRTPPRTESDRRTSKQRARWFRRAAWIAVGLAIVVALALAWRPKPVPVEVVAASRGDLIVTVDEMAKTRVRDRYVVSAPMGGNLLRIELSAGDPVKEGAVLARIVPMQPALLDPRTRAEAQARVAGAQAAKNQADAAIARAELASTHAQNELAETRKLVQGGSLAPDALTRAELEARIRAEELASARFAAQMTAHEAQMAATALRRFDSATAGEQFDVTAPATGRVLRVVKESAGPVQPGAPLLEVGDPAALEIVADVLTADAVRMQKGAKVSVVRWGGEPLDAHVRAVEPSAFTRVSALGVEEQRVPVVIDLDAPRDKWAPLGDGYRVEVRIVVAERKAVVHVPIGATFRHDGGWAVYAVREERAVRVPVELGAKSDASVEVVSGLSAGERVVVHPSERVEDGVRVLTR